MLVCDRGIPADREGVAQKRPSKSTRTTSASILTPASSLANTGTHNPYCNAAMKELLHTCFMHNHILMYYGKKLLE